jgi:hypothetical protein
MSLNTQPFKFLYPGLDSMMKRRHRIVVVRQNVVRPTDE